MKKDKLNRKINFFSPETKPAYSNKYGYILLVEITEEGDWFECEDKMMIANWIDDKWWVYCDTYINPVIEQGKHEDELQPIYFQIFKEGFFKIKGWYPI